MTDYKTELDANYVLCGPSLDPEWHELEEDARGPMRTYAEETGIKLIPSKNRAYVAPLKYHAFTMVHVDLPSSVEPTSLQYEDYKATFEQLKKRWGWVVREADVAARKKDLVDQINNTHDYMREQLSGLMQVWEVLIIECGGAELDLKDTAYRFVNLAEGVCDVDTLEEVLFDLEVERSPKIEYLFGRQEKGHVFFRDRILNARAEAASKIRELYLVEALLAMNPLPERLASMPWASFLSAVKVRIQESSEAVDFVDEDHSEEAQLRRLDRCLKRLNSEMPWKKPATIQEKREWLHQAAQLIADLYGSVSDAERAIRSISDLKVYLSSNLKKNISNDLKKNRSENQGQSDQAWGKLLELLYTKGKRGYSRKEQPQKRELLTNLFYIARGTRKTDN